MKQHIVKYVNNICFSSITEHPDRSYHPMVYRATKSFTLEPHDEVLVFMNQCAAYWFRMSLIHDVIFEDKQIFCLNETLILYREKNFQIKFQLIFALSG